MGTTSPYLQHEDDYQAVRVLLQHIYAVDGPPDYCTVGDLDWWRSTDSDPDAIRRARLWFGDDGSVIGFVWPNDDSVDHVSHPRHRDLEPEMVRWALGECRVNVKHTSMAAFAYESHTWRQEQLASLGFERREPVLRYWHRPLHDVPDPQPVAGYRIRHVQGEADLEDRVAAHRDAFAPSRMTIEKHRAVMASPTYRPELDIIAEAPNGDIAAYCIVWFDDANAHGVFEPVGCRAAHRQRGLATAILFEGMQRLRRLGARTASVVSQPSGDAANRLYASAGFTMIDVNEKWVARLS